MIHYIIEGTLTVLLAAACIACYRLFRLWRSESTENRELRLRLEAMTVRRRRSVLASRRRRLRNQAMKDRYRHSVLASRKRQKRASLKVRFLQERQRGAIDALTAKHAKDIASVEAKRQRAIDEAAPLVGEAIGLRYIVEFLEGDREKFKAGLLRFGKQLDVAKASADIIKVGMQLKDWVKSFVPVPNNLLQAPIERLLGNP